MYIHEVVGAASKPSMVFHMYDSESYGVASSGAPVTVVSSVPGALVL